MSLNLRQRYRSTCLSAVACAALWAAGACDRNETAPAPDTGLAASGAQLYGQYCASCHGTSGTGDGPGAASLATPPADLTTLSQRAGGQFDEGAVMAKIDGREEVAAHGSREMPVWGAIFEGDVPGQTRAFHLALLQTRALTEYVASIQEE